MKVIIAGDREIRDLDIINRAVKKSGFDIKEVVSGGARGVDKCGEDWANANNLPIKRFVANWNDLNHKDAIIKDRVNPWNKRIERYNANAGFARNEEMAKYADALIAIQTAGPTNGTQDMIKRAKAHNLKVYIFEKDDQDYKYDF